MEDREQCSDWEFKFELWPVINGRELYVETRFDDREDPEDSQIIVVNIHPPQSVSWDER